MPTSEPYAYVDPTWGPPASARPPTSAGRAHQASADQRRPGWLPLVAVIMVTVLVAGGLLVATQIGGAMGGTAAAEYLPGDGSATYQQRQTSIGDESTTSSHVTESARQSGALVLAGLDFTLGSKVLGSVGGVDHLDRMQFWRTTSTMIGNLGTSQQHIRVYRVDGPVELVAESSQSGADVYSPALLELPADVRAGDGWSSEGTVGSRRYRSDLRAGPAEPGCLRVTGTIVESTSTGTGEQHHAGGQDLVRAPRRSPWRRRSAGPSSPSCRPAAGRRSIRPCALWLRTGRGPTRPVGGAATSTCCRQTSAWARAR